jgi:hypothetical protein
MRIAPNLRRAGLGAARHPGCSGSPLTLGLDAGDLLTSLGGHNLRQHYYGGVRPSLSHRPETGGLRVGAILLIEVKPGEPPSAARFLPLLDRFSGNRAEHAAGVSQRKV